MLCLFERHLHPLPPTVVSFSDYEDLWKHVNFGNYCWWYVCHWRWRLGFAKGKQLLLFFSNNYLSTYLWASLLLPPYLTVDGCREDMSPHSLRPGLLSKIKMCTPALFVRTSPPPHHPLSYLPQTMKIFGNMLIPVITASGMCAIGGGDLVRER
ncbi:hypothetical protein CEXT_632821 [Caerostris extrusa]|uniref:Uncharacterized protein n=1 Tax=Caerostris extrusa TaxID=172846 RepID=A0AAV4VUG3_CAEEX|nr:hypothetical protein CEXT_632821 [Caerostris extrusa]